MTTAELLASVLNGNAQLWVDNGEVCLRTAPSGLPDALRDALRMRKDEVRTQLEPGCVYAPLSPSQQRLWLIDQLAPGNPAYNMPLFLRLRGPLDEAAFQDALSEIIRRHEPLRTVFRTFADEPVQVVLPAKPLVLQTRDLQSLPPDAREGEARRLAREEALEPFDLSQGPLCRGLILRLGPDERLFVFTMHHICSDGWSLWVLTRELRSLYTGLHRGEPADLPAVPVHYRDFAVGHRDWLDGPEGAQQLAYWTGQLAGLEPFEIALDKPRPRQQAFRGSAVRQPIPPLLGQALRDVSASCGATLFMTLLAAFGVLMGRYGGRTDLAVATPIANRNERRLEPLIGFFVNTLILRLNSAGNPTFSEWVARTRDMALEAFDHQALPFERIVSALNPNRDLGRNPLVQILFAVQNAPKEALNVPGLDVIREDWADSVARFDFEFHVWDRPEGLSTEIQYNRDLYDSASMERLLAHWHRLLEAIVADPSQPIESLPLMDDAERELAVETWNGTARDYPADTPIHQVFESIAAANPDAAAVVQGTDRWTYGELDARANAVARQLTNAGVRPGDVVALCTDRSMTMVAATLGILKAGAAYLPVDPGLPPARVQTMLDQAKVRTALADDGAAAALPSGLGVVPLSTDASAPASNPAVPVSAHSTAYVMYTSGSTGTPKGVRVTHRNVVRLVCNTDYADLGPQETLLQFAPISFDAATFEIWGALLTGGRLVVAPPGPLSLEELGTVIREQRVTTLWLTAGLFHQMVDTNVDALSGLRQLLAGGDVLDPDRCRRVLAACPELVLINGYGPTECTTFSCCHRMADLSDVGSRVPIGRPIANTRVYVLDGQRQPQPIGVPGELYIGGDGVARGYLGADSQSADHFLSDPFRPGQRMYKTGDFVRWLPDGRIDFLGRRDNQVKVRGFRIELGEIESALRAVPGVQDAVVIARPDASGSKSLAAYVVAPAVPAPGDIRRDLLDKLPSYMVPQFIIPIASMPLNANGKVDRAALPPPGADVRRDGKEPPRTDLEMRLVSLWQTVLRAESISIDGNFFDLGGHSLLATQLVSRIRTSLGADISLNAFFEAPTVRAVAERITHMSRTGQGTLRLEPLPRPGRFPLSFAQQRLWFMDRLMPDNPFYNIFGALRLHGRLDHKALRVSFEKLTERHETLRTRFAGDGDKAVQVIAEPMPFELPVIDLSNHDPATREGALVEWAEQEAFRTFDLAKGPLFRATLLHAGPDRHVLLVTMHHIISDGWSLGVLVREIGALYAAHIEAEQAALPPLPVQYADYTVWQRKRQEGGEWDRQEAYWKERLAGLRPLELPPDRLRPQVLSYQAGVNRVYLPKRLHEALLDISHRQGATLFMTLFAAFSVLLNRYTQRTDIAVASPIANRNRQEVEGLIGFFVNTLVMRCDLDGDPPFTALVGRVREAALQAYDHQDLPFEYLVSQLNPDRDVSRNPLVQMVFAVQNAPLKPLELPGLHVEPMRLGLASTRFDLEFHVWERGDSLLCELMYSQDLYTEATIERFLEQWQTLLQHIALDPSKPCSKYAILNEPQRARLLVDWNATARPYPQETTIHALFDAQAQATPDAIAVEQDGTVWTYAALAGRATQIAQHLAADGVRAGEFVGLCLDRSLDMVAATLGILKAGAAYVPLDAELPPQRMARMCADAGVTRVITDQQYAPVFSAYHTILVEEVRGDDSARNALAAPRRAAAEGPAYAMFTSGSTGEPKGVAVSHRNVIRLVRNTDYVRLDASETLLQFAPISFDAATFEIWGALLNGGRLLIAPPTPLSLAELGALIRDGRATTLWLTAGLFHQMVDDHLDDLRGLRQLLAGGDVLDPARCERVLRAAPGITLINGYGPTECTTFACCHVMQSPDDVGIPVPIGRPIANTTVYVLDEGLTPVPVGVPGELYIGGGGVASGYLNQPERTAERFVPDIFAGTGYMYRTGDFVRWRDNGVLEFLGRRDNQVKIRGFRVELGEIQSAIQAHSAVKDCAVTAHEDASGTKSLAAFVVPVDGLADYIAGLDAHDHVNQWQTLYDDTYAEGLEQASTLDNFQGWNSSYTGDAIPLTEMRQWVDAVTDRISSLNPTRVLEIGCGTGLLLGRIASKCARYVGLDFSSAVLEHTRRLVASHDDLSHVELRQGRADELDGFEPGSFDAIILNSIVQYFPNMDYLADVLERAIALLAPGGHLYLGDIRSYPLQEAFAASVEAQHAPGNLTPVALRARVTRRMRQEEELLVDPAFFHDFAQRCRRPVHVWTEPKRGRYVNELSRFRYEVILRVGEPAAATLTPDWIDGANLSLEGLRRIVREAEDGVAVRNLPNARLSGERQILAWLDDSSCAATLDSVRAANAPDGFDVDDVVELGEAHGFQVVLDWTEQAEGAFAAVFAREAGVCLTAQRLPQKPWRAYGNDPLQATYARRIVPELRRWLEERLPNYMVPQSFTVLDELPLTANGKVDRRALPIDEAAAAAPDTAYAAPGTALERELALIWFELLGTGQIGVNDSFFDIGGHSLMATQLVSRIRDRYGVELALRRFFERPTIAGLCALIEETAPASVPAEADNDGLAAGTLSEEEAILADIDNLSEDEVDALLQQMGERKGGGTNMGPWV